MEKLKRFFNKTPVRIAVVALCLLFVGAVAWGVGANALNVPCVFHSLTGLWCPGCGTGRAGRALLRFDIITALRCNPFAVTALPFCLFYLVRFAYRYIAGKSLTENLRLPNIAVYIFLGLWLVFSIVRNIPVYPFTLLAPPV